MRPRAGVVLVLTLLALLVLECVAAAAFHLATEQVRISRNQERLLQLEAAARAAAAARIAAWPDSFPIPAAAGTTVGLLSADVETAPGISTSLTLESLGNGLVLLRSLAVTGLGERRAIGLVLRERQPGEYLAALEAVASARRAVGAGSSVSPTPSSSCPDAAAQDTLPALALTDTVGSPGARLLAITPVPYVLAGIDLRALPAAATVHAGNLRIDDTEGHGVLVVIGDLELAPDARFDGLVIVTGSITLRGGAIIAGAVRAGGELLIDGGSIRYEPCVLLPLFATRALRGPFPAGTHWYLPFL